MRLALVGRRPSNKEWGMESGLTRRDLVKRGGLVAGAAALGPAIVPGAARSATARPLAQADLTDFSHLKGKTVGHVVIDIAATFPTRSAAEAKRLAKKYGFNVEIVDGAGDYNKINQALTTFATKKVAAILDTGCDPTLCKPGLLAAKQAKIPVGSVVAGFVDGLNAYDVESNDWINFSRVGTYVANRLGIGGGWGAAIINWPNVPALRIRSAQAKAMLSYYKAPLLADLVVAVPGFVADAKQKASALLTKYPKGGKLKVIVCGWDDVGVAAAQACVEAGRSDVFVVATDGNLAAFDMMRKGQPFAATCSLDVEGMTSVMYAQMSEVLGRKKPLATTLYVDAPLITRRNAPPKGQYPKGAGLQLYT
jgi:ribose transport system substrate-binding protein